jgi:hypothetical protein
LYTKTTKPTKTTRMIYFVIVVIFVVFVPRRGASRPIETDKTDSHD